MKRKYDAVIYTDGSAKGNPGKGGYGLIIEQSQNTIELSEGFEYTTNNRMELLAAIIGLEKLEIKNMKILIVSDSKYVVDSVVKKWVFNWEKNAFSKRLNADLWKRFLIVYRKHQVDFEWIKGHNNHTQNDRCDKLAILASETKNLSIDSYYKGFVIDYPF